MGQQASAQPMALPLVPALQATGAAHVAAHALHSHTCHMCCPCREEVARLASELQRSKAGSKDLEAQLGASKAAAKSDRDTAAALQRQLLRAKEEHAGEVAKMAADLAKVRAQVGVVWHTGWGRRVVVAASPLACGVHWWAAWQARAECGFAAICTAKCMQHAIRHACQMHAACCMVLSGLDKVWGRKDPVMKSAACLAVAAGA